MVADIASRPDGLKKDWPLWVIGVALMLAYERFGDHRPFVPVLLLTLPAIIKLLVACAIVGWRKALIPQEPRTPIFLPFTNRQTTFITLWIEVVCVIAAVGALVALATWIAVRWAS
jgi:chromate transport protein ChrA